MAANPTVNKNINLKWVQKTPTPSHLATHPHTHTLSNKNTHIEREKENVKKYSIRLNNVRSNLR